MLGNFFLDGTSSRSSFRFYCLLSLVKCISNSLSTRSDHTTSFCIYKPSRRSLLERSPPKTDSFTVQNHLFRIRILLLQKSFLIQMDSFIDFTRFFSNNTTAEETEIQHDEESATTSGGSYCVIA